MHLSIDRQRLIEAVQDVLKAVSSRTTIPILTGIKMEADEEGVRLTGSDSDISIERFVPLEENDEQYIELHQPGSVVLQARFFSEIIRKLPADTVELEVMDRFSTKIKSGQSEFNLNGLDPEEYPRLPLIEEQNSFQIDAQLLKHIIRQTVFAVSTSETRPVLTGVNWSFKNGKIESVATDSHRLALRHVTIEGASDTLSFSNVIIPGKSLNELSKIIDDHTDWIDVVVTENQILFKAKHTLFYSRLLDGNYPDTSKLIPTESKTSIVVATKQFLQAIERASLLAREGRNNVVKLVNLDDKTMEISSNSPEVGKVFEQIEADSFDGEELKISFSAKYMIDALRTIDATSIIIDFTGAMRPFLIRPVDDSSILQLILPVRTF
ncbi:DNA polymerase III subunit beta [Pueribacillus theae]|uniref:Beta sliding clamp n=1 Tax=Pueribacillus theae TaxID=2171751 RepID=A0A2U1K3F6_9BACI|nr:DNA polymerase III subunit beta [Pueribacillus theae]PWA12067.1 DNA polymerase III subunit beta [Pueribacillus theae]